MDDFNAFFMGVAITTIFFIILFATITNDNVDIDDSLGPYMCEQHGYKFDSYEIEYSPDQLLLTKITKLKITCTEIKEQQIDDGYLILK